MYKLVLTALGVSVLLPAIGYGIKKYAIYKFRKDLISNGVTPEAADSFIDELLKSKDFVGAI